MERPVDASGSGSRPLGEPVGSSSAAHRLEPGYEEASLGELFSRMTSDVSTLLSKEVQLAKVEIREEVTKAGKGAGMLGGSGITAIFALLMLSFAAAWGLAAVMPTGFAFLIMGILYLLATGALFITGRQELRSVRPKPEQTIQTLEEDAQWARRQMS